MEKTGFGFFAPQAPEPKSLPEIDSPLLLSDFTKTDGTSADEPTDPVGQLIAKTQADTELAKISTVTDERLTSLLFAPADVRRPVTPLSKGAAASSDWSWSTPVSDTLEKRAHGTAREKFRQELEKFCAGHNDEFWEALAVCDQAVDDERASILAGEA
jgi:hypothetical protein